METWGFVIHLQLASLKIDLNI